MGYNLSIGEAKISWSEDCVSIDCDEVKLDYAPAYGDPTDFTNQRWPSYTTWHNVMSNLDLMDVMYSEGNHGASDFEWQGKTYYPLLANHPGAAPITKAHVEVVEMKLDNYKRKFPNHIAQYPPLKDGVVKTWVNTEEDYVKDARYDGNLCRGEWLLFWLKWAIENCKYPVFVNS